MELNKMSDFIKSKTAIFIIVILFVIAIIISSFSLGVSVGYRKARFSYAWGENYHKNFGGPRGGFLMSFTKDFMGGDFIEAHGAFGLIIAISDSELVIKGKDNVEKIITINEKTDIRRFHDAITIKDLVPDEHIVVIGNPNDQGKIDAKFIRVMPATPNLPMPFQLKIK
ncbi:MAG: hypothetical protein A2908_03570 [Candidatus Staskawiczbacteria bacterium RIFCSPLOWO2_01_FULL_38_12b]|uniref:DUF5666 domain-containing protein n=1 Tax=Candidatus Staskawiczbacteria bacterium RIFCSPLOWO2_01_FULL_38_12b TaxID=1802214 RepID=A0A1G2ID06_9BACT|nr:MAG: hypothetical protein A2908_03570 [Candidatus Staskawiczbacteria bacterium RIFCSPLOWO2_01_FULL_38_12b]